MRDGSPEAVHRVSGEIDGLRGELGALVAELARRRRELLDLRLQARRHPAVLIAAAGVAALVVGGVVALSVRARRQRQRPIVRARETRRALARLLDHPDRVAAEPNIGMKILAAAGTAAGSLLAKRAVGLLWSRASATPGRAGVAPRRSAAAQAGDPGLGRS